MLTLCINLDSRPDRWEQVSREFERIGLSVERFPAITGDNRCLAFNKSVYECMKLARVETKEGVFYHDLLLFEDDVVFELDNSIDILTRLNFINAGLLHNGKKYMTIHLGANIIGMSTTEWQMPTAFSERSALLHNCWQSHATLYSGNCVKYIIENFKYVTDEYEREGLIIFDEWLRTNVLPMGRSYVMNPMIAYQRPDHSDIWSVPADYTGAHKQGNEWLKKNL